MQAILAQFFAQCAAIDAQYFGGTALIAIDIAQHCAEQWFFDFANDQIVKFAGLVAVQVCKVSIEGVRGLITQRDGIAVRMMPVVAVITIVPIMIVMVVTAAISIGMVQRFR